MRIEGYVSISTNRYLLAIMMNAAIRTTMLTDDQGEIEFMSPKTKRIWKYGN